MSIGSRTHGRRVAAVLTLCMGVLLLAFGATTANAAISASLSLTNSTNQAAGHPDTTITITPKGDQVKGVKLDFPAGLAGNPEAGNPKCSNGAFNFDLCPLDSVVGSSVISVTALGLPLDVNGTVYVLSPDSTDAATLGIVSRPSLGLIALPKIFTKIHITIRPNDGGLVNTINDIPNQLIGIGLNVRKLKLTLNRRSGLFANNAFFMFNPHNCTAATSTLSVTAYSGATSQPTTSTFTPTNCQNVPFKGGATTTVGTTQAGASTAVAVTLTFPTADANIQNSYARNVVVTLPFGSAIDFPTLGTVGTCNQLTQLPTDTCPANSDIGDTLINVPFLPPIATGDIYATQNGNFLGFGAVIRGARNVKVFITGRADAIDSNGDGEADTVQAKVSNIPQLPQSSSSLLFTKPLLDNPATCGDNTVTHDLTGWSGATFSTTSTYATTGC